MLISSGRVKIKYSILIVTTSEQRRVQKTDVDLIFEKSRAGFGFCMCKSPEEGTVHDKYTSRPDACRRVRASGVRSGRPSTVRLEHWSNGRGDQGSR